MSDADAGAPPEYRTTRTMSEPVDEGAAVFQEEALFDRLKEKLREAWSKGLFNFVCALLNAALLSSCHTLTRSFFGQVLRASGLHSSFMHPKDLEEEETSLKLISLKSLDQPRNMPVPNTPTSTFTIPEPELVLPDTASDEEDWSRDL